MLDPACREPFKCARECQCAAKASAVYRLLKLHLDPLADSTNVVTTTFVKGYSAILVGLVMVDDDANEALVVAALADDPGALNAVLTAMEDFARLHEVGEEEEAGEGEGAMEGVAKAEENTRGKTARAIRGMVDKVRAR